MTLQSVSAPRSSRACHVRQDAHRRPHMAGIVCALPKGLRRAACGALCACARAHARPRATRRAVPPWRRLVPWPPSTTAPTWLSLLVREAAGPFPHPNHAHGVGSGGLSLVFRIFQALNSS
jgi:hypothetical protein